MARDEGAGAGNILLAFILGAVSGAARPPPPPPEAAAKGRDALNQGRETLNTAIERGREAYQQARRDNT